MPKVDVERLPSCQGSDYPAPFDAAASDRTVRVLSEAMGLSDFVATHVTVPPGGWSSQRHWHEGEDELVIVLSGEAVLVDDAGRHPMRAGDVATFRKGVANAHHLRNESDSPCVLFAVSLPEASTVRYPDIAMRWHPLHGYEADRRPGGEGAH
ncbi:cupin domain-containing protein [Sphingomonas yunnanensis]|uniref:cupin domain-containing protein n=1 Tax=Sphingomonas yunnanensis TaxID=310400 RepID=UPI001CA77793|nr:cupin domain-containing protein [Sphingomonas yunnanensis]MBY9061416.1 cupin domain-containing protein [Sphingomonas yunnanensis]